MNWSLADSSIPTRTETNGVDINAPAITVGPWIEMDPATERFQNNDAANALLTRPYRAGFVVPECPV